MRYLLFLSGALALAAGPALTQTAPAPEPRPAPSPAPPSSYVPYGPFDGAAQFGTKEDPRRQCFNGRFVVGSNRAGDRTVYVQTRTGGIFRLGLKDACAALNAAERLTVRANGNDVICPGQAATLVLKTAAGPRQCVVGEVSHLNATEVADLVSEAGARHRTATELARR